MYRAIPIQNKLVHQRKRDKDDETHSRMLQQMKSRVDTQVPESTRLSFLHNRKNKEKV